MTLMRRRRRRKRGREREKEKKTRRDGEIERESTDRIGGKRGEQGGNSGQSLSERGVAEPWAEPGAETGFKGPFILGSPFPACRAGDHVPIGSPPTRRLLFSLKWRLRAYRVCERDMGTAFLLNHLSLGIISLTLFLYARYLTSLLRHLSPPCNIGLVYT